MLTGRCSLLHSRFKKFLSATDGFNPYKVLSSSKPPFGSVTIYTSRITAVARMSRDEEPAWIWNSPGSTTHRC